MLISFSTSKCLVLSELIFSLKCFSLSWKSVCVTKSACFNLAGNFVVVKSLSSWVVIYLSWLWSLIFFSISIIFDFLTKLITLGILLSTAVNAVSCNQFQLMLLIQLLARWMVSGILISAIFVLKYVFVTKLFTIVN